MTKNNCKALQLLDNTIEKVLKQAENLRKLEAERKIKKDQVQIIKKLKSCDKENVEASWAKNQSLTEQTPSEGQFANWIPPEQRRPEDEFFNLKSLTVLRSEDLLDGSVTKLVLQEGSGSPADIEDIVYYKHETRFDNGQLVDIDERRKVVDKCPMNDPGFHDFLKAAFNTMPKGEVAYLRVSQEAHQGMYHSSTMSIIRSAEEKAKIRASVGTDIYIKVSLSNIKRDPKCEQHAPWPDRLRYFEKVRITGRELCAENEWSNAQKLYSRCIGLFRNVSKAQRELLSEIDLAKQKEIMNLLLLNVTLCYLKKNMPQDAIKSALDALTFEPASSKAHYRLYLAHKSLNKWDLAKEHLEQAIAIEPQNREVRAEHKQFCEDKKKKDREWYDKMSGFYKGDKLQKIERDDEEEASLRHKLERQLFN